MSWNNGIDTPNATSPAPSPLSITLSGALAAITVSASAATQTSQSTRSPAFSVTKGLPRTISCTTTSQAAAYAVGSVMTVTGTDTNGNTITDTLSLTQTNGGETVVTAKAFVTVTSIVIPAQLTTAGAIAFATKDIALPRLPRTIRVGTAGSGTLHVGYMSDKDGTVLADSITGVTAGENLPIAPKWIYMDSTVQDITLLF